MLFKFGADWAVFSGADAGAGSVISGTGTVASDMGSAAFSSGLVLTSGREIGGSLDARLERTRGLSQSAASDSGRGLSVQSGDGRLGPWVGEYSFHAFWNAQVYSPLRQNTFRLLVETKLTTRVVAVKR